MQRSHRPTTMIHSNVYRTPSTIATARRPSPNRRYVARRTLRARSTVRYLLRNPIVALTIAVSCLLGAGAIGEAQEAARIDAQIAQARVENDHISQQITQTNATIVQLSQDSAIIIAALKLGYVMLTRGANP